MLQVQYIEYRVCTRVVYIYMRYERYMYVCVMSIYAFDRMVYTDIVYTHEQHVIYTYTISHTHAI